MRECQPQGRRSLTGSRHPEPDRLRVLYKLPRSPSDGSARVLSAPGCRALRPPVVIMKRAPLRRRAEKMDASLEGRVGLALKAHGWTLAVAESCTGGLVADRITDVAGSSEYFLGGVVAYANMAKERILGVRASTLESHGAVSQETAVEMAKGVRRAFGADLAVAVTGIAGPGGAQADKPVG